MKKKSLVLLLILIASPFLISKIVYSGGHSEITTDDNTIYIQVVEGELNFNNTEIHLQPSTNYTIVFINPEDFAGHNFRIDIDGDLIDTQNTDDDDDLIIGAQNNAGLEGANNTWYGSWETPDNEDEVIYYCGYGNHYANGMEGVFIIHDGQNEGETPLPTFIVIISLLSLAILTDSIRKR